MAKNANSSIRVKFGRGTSEVGRRPVTADLAPSLGLKNVRVVLVNSLVPGLSAAKGATRGRCHSDNRRQTDRRSELISRSNQEFVAGTVTLTVLRAGRERRVSLNVGEFRV